MNNYGVSNMNQSFGGYSSKAGASMNQGAMGASMMGHSPAKGRTMPAGVLNSKTLAEENLKGFRLRNLQKESDLPLRVNQAQRIELPIYFNTPKRKEDIIINYGQRVLKSIQRLMEVSDQVSRLFQAHRQP